MYPVEIRLTPFNHYDGRVCPIRLIVIHATRSGKPGNDDYPGTIDWCWNQASGVSAHVLTGLDGRRCRIVSDWDTAWHCGWMNPASLGIEIVQCTADTPFTEASLRSAAEQVAEWCIIHSIPPISGCVVGHEDTEQGQSCGKSDPGDLLPWPEFFEMVEENMMTDEEARKQIALINLTRRWKALIDLGQIDIVVREAVALGVPTAG